MSKRSPLFCFEKMDSLKLSGWQLDPQTNYLNFMY